MTSWTFLGSNSITCLGVGGRRWAWASEPALNCSSSLRVRTGGQEEDGVHKAPSADSASLALALVSSLLPLLRRIGLVGDVISGQSRTDSLAVSARRACGVAGPGHRAGQVGALGAIPSRASSSPQSPPRSGPPALGSQRRGKAGSAPRESQRI